MFGGYALQLFCIKLMLDGLITKILALSISSSEGPLGQMCHPLQLPFCAGSAKERAARIKGATVVVTVHFEQRPKRVGSVR